MQENRTIKKEVVMDFFDKLVGFLVAKNAIRFYQKELQNDYLHKSAILAERERELRAVEERAEAERQKWEEKLRRTLDELDEHHREMVVKHETKLAEYEAKIAELKQQEGDHSDEIKEQECFADYERDMVRIYKKSLGEGEYPG